MPARPPPPPDSPDGAPPRGPASRPPADPEQAALDVALRLLALRGRSRQELVLALGRKGFPPEVQQRVLQRLEGFGYLDDTRFALERARALFARGRYGARAVRERLLAHGLPEALAQEAVARVEEELGVDPLEAGRLLLEKRGLWGRSLPPRERARAARLLEARGFDEDAVLRLLGRSGLDPYEGEG